METLIQNLIGWLLSHGIKIFGILVGAYLVNRFFQIFTEKVIQRHLADRLSKGGKRRMETLISDFIPNSQIKLVSKKIQSVK